MNGQHAGTVIGGSSQPHVQRLDRSGGGLGSAEIMTPDILFSTARENEFLLGSGLLQRFTLTFDLAGRRARFS